MKQSITRSELIEIIKEILREINEASTTANVPGYQTPYAFSGGLAKNKKKKKELIKRLHMKLVGKLDESKDDVQMMKVYFNDKTYSMRARGQYLDKSKLSDGESWRTYDDGQPLHKSKCIRLYIDKKRESA